MGPAFKAVLKARARENGDFDCADEEDMTVLANRVLADSRAKRRKAAAA